MVLKNSIVNKTYLKLIITAVFICVTFFKVSTECFAADGIVVSHVLVLDKSQFPDNFKKFNPTAIYILFSGNRDLRKFEKLFIRQDTITNFTMFKDSLAKEIEGYRLIFSRENKIDSAWQLNPAYAITYKAINAENYLLKILEYNAEGKLKDQFLFNYGKKFKKVTIPESEFLALLFKEYIIYTPFDRNEYAVNSVWILSVGIDDYGPTQWESSKSDAVSYIDFFKKQFSNQNGFSDDVLSSLFHEYLLLDKEATKPAIIRALKEIASKAAYNDYFIFNFSGQSNMFGKDSATYFFPYEVAGYIYTPFNRNPKDTTPVLKNLLTLKSVQENVQYIQANNQLFISEAGPSEKFKTELIRTMMQNSPAIASILNKNRIIIVPEKYGLDKVYCNGESYNKGPINYYITTLDAKYNIYDIFSETGKANEIAYSLKNKGYSCKSFDYEYFDVFFEKQFLKQYQEISGMSAGKKRGVDPEKIELDDKEAVPGKKYALVVGIDNYKGEGWDKLYNPVYDAVDVADVLKYDYGFEVRLLSKESNTTMDSIYQAILDYSRTLKVNDQFIIYFAGHGDFEERLLDDGFIVCADSRSRDDDPMRNSYIQHSKLKKMLNKLRARQVLVMLDICFGGVFDDQVLNNKIQDDALFKKKVPEENLASISFNNNVEKFISEQSKLKSRKSLSSVGSEPAFDGSLGQHSPFANLLLQVLRTKGAGSNGIVTLANIYAVLQEAALSDNAVLKVSPHIASFGDSDPYSEFMLIPIAAK